MCASVKESCVHGVMWERRAVVCGVCFSEGELCVSEHGVMWERGAVVCGVCFSEGELCVVSMV